MFSLKAHNIFVQQLKDCVKSGIPIIRSFDILSRNSSQRRLRKVSRNMALDIQQGASLKQALHKHSRHFDPLLLSCLTAGEKSGQLEEFLEELEEYYTNILDIRRRAVNELFFPVLELTFMLTILIALPSIIKYFIGISQATVDDVPFYSFLLYVRQTILITLGALVLFLFIFKLLSLIPVFKGLFDFTLLRIPVIGKILKKIALYKLLMSFSFLVKGGLDVQTMFNHSSASCNNTYLARKFRRSWNVIHRGGNIKEAFHASRIFPPLVIESVNIGEQTGKLDEHLQKTAREMIQQVFLTLKLIPKFLIPIMLVIMGLLVLKLALEIYIKPIIDVMETL